MFESRNLVGIILVGRLGVCVRCVCLLRLSHELWCDSCSHAWWETRVLLGWRSRIAGVYARALLRASAGNRYNTGICEINSSFSYMCSLSDCLCPTGRAGGRSRSHGACRSGAVGCPGPWRQPRRRRRRPMRLAALWAATVAWPRAVGAVPASARVPRPHHRLVKGDVYAIDDCDEPAADSCHAQCVDDEDQGKRLHTRYHTNPLDK